MEVGLGRARVRWVEAGMKSSPFFFFAPLSFQMSIFEDFCQKRGSVRAFLAPLIGRNEASAIRSLWLAPLCLKESGRSQSSGALCRHEVHQLNWPGTLLGFKSHHFVIFILRTERQPWHFLSSSTTCLPVEMVLES